MYKTRKHTHITEQNTSLYHCLWIGIAENYYFIVFKHHRLHCHVLLFKRFFRNAPHPQNLTAISVLSNF